MTDTIVTIGEVARIEPGPQARRLADAMYDRLLAELEALPEEAWGAETVCAPWTVADIVRHLVGAAKGHASMREMARQARHGKKHSAEHDGNDMDAMNALQVADHAALAPPELLDALRSIAPRAVAKRMSRPRFLHRIRLPNAPGGSTASGMPAALTLGQLLTVILTRDVFLHRLDIARATGRALGSIDADHEGRLVADVIAEWAERHGQPFRLTLSGPAGGSFRAGDGGPELSFDALEFCWLLSGRGEAPHPLVETRVLF